MVPVVGVAVRVVLAGMVFAAQGSTQQSRRSTDERLKSELRHTQPVSPTIEKLRSPDGDQDFDAEAFWREIAKAGTPLVEPVVNDDEHKLVTFLWRHTPEAHNVLVVGSFSLLPSLDHLMERLPGTNIWYLTIKVPAGARFAYKLSVNDPLVFDGPGAAQRDKTKQADPLNPHRWFDKPGASRFEYASRVELPGAPDQPWIIKDLARPAGKVDKQRYESEMLGNIRDIWVYTPPGYSRKGAPSSLLLLFDGQAYLDYVPTPTILDNLIHVSRIPPTVGVLVGNPSQAVRNTELAPNQLFADFLAEELVPWIRDR